MRMAAYFGDVPDDVDALAEDVASVFGGSTVFHGTGRWYDGDRNLFVESAHIVETYTADTVHNRGRFTHLVRLALEATDEQSAMIVIGNDEPIFLENDRPCHKGSARALADPCTICKQSDISG